MRRTPRNPRHLIASSEELAAALAERNRCNSQSLRKAMWNVSGFYDEVLAPSGLRGTQRSVLMNVARAGSPTINQLAQMLGLDRTALSRALRPLMRDKLIAAVPGQNDKRVRCMTLTRKGDEKLRESLYLWRTAQDQFERIFGQEEARVLRETLERVAALELRPKK